MRLATLIALIAGALMLSSATPSPACAALGTCGLKPLPPLGCKDLCAQCQCDATGSDCRWVWNCCGSSGLDRILSEFSESQSAALPGF